MFQQLNGGSQRETTQYPVMCHPKRRISLPRYALDASSRTSRLFYSLHSRCSSFNKALTNASPSPKFVFTPGPSNGVHANQPAPERLHRHHAEEERYFHYSICSTLYPSCARGALRTYSYFSFSQLGTHYYSDFAIPNLNQNHPMHCKHHMDCFVYSFLVLLSSRVSVWTTFLKTCMS